MEANNETPPGGGPQIGRNEPCPCGSGKKYKRCCGVAAAPKLSAPNFPAGAAGGMPAGLDQMDPAMMMQVTQALQKLPRAQMQKLQSIMQRAMAGKDVSREAEEFERQLPPEFKDLLKGFAPPQAEGAPAESAAEMSESDARRIVEQAVAAGKLTPEQAANLLKAQPEAPAAAAAEEPAQPAERVEKTETSEAKGGISRLWRGWKGK